MRCFLQVAVDYIHGSTASSTRFQPAALRLRGGLADGAVWAKWRRIQGSVTTVLRVPGATSWPALQWTFTVRLSLSGKNSSQPSS